MILTYNDHTHTYTFAKLKKLYLPVHFGLSIHYLIWGTLVCAFHVFDINNECNKSDFQDNELESWFFNITNFFVFKSFKKWYQHFKPSTSGCAFLNQLRMAFVIKSIFFIFAAQLRHAIRGRGLIWSGNVDCDIT